MGKAPLKPCKHPGCKEYAVVNGYCEKHKKDKFNFYKDVKRISPSKLGYNRRWESLLLNLVIIEDGIEKEKNF